MSSNTQQYSEKYRIPCILTLLWPKLIKGLVSASDFPPNENVPPSSTPPRNSPSPPRSSSSSPRQHASPSSSSRPQPSPRTTPPPPSPPPSPPRQRRHRRRHIPVHPLTDDFTTLGVAPSAPLREVTAAYRRLARELSRTPPSPPR